MNDVFLRLYIAVQTLVVDEEGQDMVEYAMVIALIAFGSVAGAKTLATALKTAFQGISTTMGSYVS